MLVYRLCDGYEYNTIIKEKTMTNIGGFFEPDHNINTHNYLPGVRYMHFFEKMADVTFWYSIKGFFICTYDIPDEILEKFRGVGYYNERLEFYGLEKANEFAVPSNLVEFSNLVKVQKILQTILFEDFYDDSYKKLLLTVYDEQGPLLGRKG